MLSERQRIRQQRMYKFVYIHIQRYIHIYGYIDIYVNIQIYMYTQMYIERGRTDKLHARIISCRVSHTNRLQFTAKCNESSAC